jgi:hypothetical protein
MDGDECGSPNNRATVGPLSESLKLDYLHGLRGK